MFLPKRHLLIILQFNRVEHPVRVPCNPPESAIFYFGDLEVYGFGTLGVVILYYDADDAGGKEVAYCLRREDDAGPVGESVLSDWGKSTWHCGESEFCCGESRMD